MDILRRVGLWFSKALFQLELVGWLSVTSLVIMIGSAGPIKQTLDQANLYERLPDIVLKQGAMESEEGEIPLDDTIIRDLIKNQFPPDKLQAHTEELVDGMYNWLTGKTEKPDFRIDLGDARVAIAEGVAQRAVDRMKTLPPCTQIPAGPIEPFSIDCRPPGLNLDREKQRLTNEILAHKEFLPNGELTADQLFKAEDGQTFTDKYGHIPKIFGLFTKLPWILGVAGVLTAVAIVWLSSDKRRGVRSVGRMVLGTGTFVLVTCVLFGVLLPKLSDTLQARFITGEGAPLMNDMLRGILQNSNKALYITSGSLAALGAAILLAERFIKPKEQTSETETSKPADAVKKEQTTEPPQTEKLKEAKK